MTISLSAELQIQNALLVLGNFTMYIVIKPMAEKQSKTVSRCIVPVPRQDNLVLVIILDGYFPSMLSLKRCYNRFHFRHENYQYEIFLLMQKLSKIKKSAKLYPLFYVFLQAVKYQCCHVDSRIKRGSFIKNLKWSDFNTLLA